MKSILRRTTGRTVSGPEPSSVEPAEPPAERDTPSVEQELQPRPLAAVPWQEVRRAVTDMCAQLRVPVRVAGQYDLYAAVAAEWGKSHQAKA